MIVLLFFLERISAEHLGGETKGHQHG